MASETRDFVTIRLGGQLLGIPVLAVHDVLNAQNVTQIPLAPRAVAGVLNLRGRVVTAIDLRSRLNMPPKKAEQGNGSMSVVVEQDGESYSLFIDEIGEVLSLDMEDFEKNPVTLDARWREVAVGVFQLEEELLVVLDVARLLQFEDEAEAA